MRPNNSANNSSRTCHKVRVAELDTEGNDKLEKLLEKFSQQIINDPAPSQKNISNAIVACDHQLQGEAHNTDPFNEMCRKPKTEAEV